MLILTRKPGESLYIGDTIKVVVVEVKGNQVRLGIQADKSLRIYREEIYIQILEENRKAADVAQSSAEGLEGLSDAWRDRKGGATTGRSGLDPLRIDQVTAGGTGAGSESLKSPLVIKRRKKKSDE